jgi:hypothetical protein
MHHQHSSLTRAASHCRATGMTDLDVVLSLGSPLRPPPTGIPGVFDQTRGILTYVDAQCPGPEQLAAAGGRFVCVAGRYIRGAEELSAGNAWVVGQGYRQVCGDANVWGDGITPADWALLPGAEHVTLEGVFHSPVGAGEGRPWYGTPGVLEQWVGCFSGVGGAAIKAVVAQQ